MQQDSNNIENQLRQLENKQLPDLSHMDAHWQQLQVMMQPSAYSIKRRIYARPMARVAVGLFILAGIAFLLRYEKNENGKDDIASIAKPSNAGNTIIALPEKANAATQKKDTQKIEQAYIGNSNRAKINSGYAFTKNASLAAEEKISDKPCDGCPGISQSNTPGVIAAKINNEEKDKEMLLDFFTAIEKPSQQFVINNLKDTSLLCMEGTKVFIPANVFVSINNGSLNSEITIVIKEFYSYEDIISNKLSTTSNGRQLISGGMLYIAAMQNGKEVKLAETKKINIKMPVAEYNEEMQLFMGEKSVAGKTTESPTIDFAYDYAGNDNINWQPSGQFQRLQRTKFYIKIFDPYGQPYQSWETSKGITVGRFVIRRDCPMSNALVLEGLRGHYGLFYNKIKLRRSLSNRPGPMFSKRKWPIVGDSILIEYTKAKQLKLASKADIEKYEQKLIQDSAIWNEKLKKIPFYEFQISKLGFMNCDRFENGPYPKVEFTLNLGEGEDATNFFSVLAFNKYKSVMQGYAGKNKLMFSRIPDNADVHLISVGVKDGKVLSCIKPLQVSTAEIGGLKYEETTPEKFKSQIASLHLK